MTAVAGGRLPVFPPDVGYSELLEDGVLAAGGDERQTANGGSRITCGTHEARVLAVGDRKAADEELADVHSVHRTLVLIRRRTRP